MSNSEWFAAKQAEHRAKKPALWEYGAEILVRIDERDVTIHNGVDVQNRGITMSSGLHGKTTEGCPECRRLAELRREGK